MTDIFINGEIGGDSWDGTGEFGIIGTKFVQNKLAEIEGKEVLVHINSPGGEVSEGFAIHDILENSEKEISTIIEGNCSSIATVVLLAAKKENRKATENSTGMIHNPWKISIGNSDELQEDVDLLKEKEAQLLDFYVAKTGSTRDELENLMAEEKELTANDLLDLGFISTVAETVKGLKKPNKIFAKAYFNRNMKKDKENKTLMAQLDGFYAKLKALVTVKDGKHEDEEDKNKKTAPAPRAEEQQLADGTRIFINGDEGNFGGKEVFLIGEDGSLGEILPDGEHPLGDGRVLRIENGTITEVTEQMEETVVDPNALKAKVTKLEAEVKRLKQGAISKGLEMELSAELKNIKAQITSNGTPVQGNGNFNQTPEPKTKRSKVFDRAQKRWDKNKKTIKN